MKAVSILMLVILIFCTLFSFAACTAKDPAPTVDVSGETPTDPGTTEPNNLPNEELDLTAVKPNEFVQKKIYAGMQVDVAFSWYNLTDDFIVLLNASLAEDLEKTGLTFTHSTAGGDIALQFSQIENYVQMGCAVIMIHTADSNNMKDLSAALLEQGIYTCFFSNLPEFDECGGSCYVDDVASGTACANMASAWIDMRYPDAGDGDVKTALYGANNTVNNTKRTNAIKDTISTDSRVDLVYTEDFVTALDEGYVGAEAALTYNSSIRLFLFFANAPSMGANNYITSVSGINLDEYGIFTTGNGNSVYELIDQSATNDRSCLRGTISQGGSVPWEGMYSVVTGLLFEGVEAPYFRSDPLWATSSFGFEFNTVE